MTPNQLLTKQLNTHIKALKKSIESFENKEIDFDTHYKHVSNLNHLIFEYKEAIKKQNA